MFHLNTNTRWIIGIFVPIIFSLIMFFVSFERPHKKLECEVLNGYTTIDKDETLQDGLKILYFGKEIENLHILIYEFRSTGNRPIGTDDFESDIELQFDKNTKVLKADIISTSPPNDAIKVYQNDSIVGIEPVLLNPDDMFRIQIFVTGERILPNLYSRIYGIDSINEIGLGEKLFQYKRLFQWFFGITWLISLVLGSILLSLLYTRDILLSIYVTRFELFAFSMAIIGMGAFIMGADSLGIGDSIHSWILLLINLAIIGILTFIFYKIKSARIKRKLSQLKNE